MLLDDDTRALRDSAERFFTEADAARLLRHRRDTRDLDGAALGAWAGMVELGFAGMLIPEAFGGVGLGSMASIQISEMMGRTLATGPFLSSAVMAATALIESGDRALQAEILPAIAAGAIVALAGEESNRHAPDSIGTMSRRDGDDFRVSGRKIAVIDGTVAERLIVVARDADRTDGLVMVLVDARQAGVTLTGRMGLDSRPVAEAVFDDARATRLVCAPDMTGAVLDRAYDAGRLHLAAEMLGAAAEAFDRTLDYLKTRTQFGRKIGEFQALRHRAAIMFGELEIARSVLLKAAATGSPLHVSLAKARIGDIANHVAAEAVQLHGGIGVTDDFDLGFFVKRIRAASESLGDSAFHAERYALLKGL
jgi:acyl-CoA dehydrogenase